MEQHPAESWGHFLTPLFSEAPPRTPGALSTCWPGPEAPLAPHPSFAAAAPPRLLESTRTPSPVPRSCAQAMWALRKQDSLF